MKHSRILQGFAALTLVSVLAACGGKAAAPAATEGAKPATTQKAVKTFKFSYALSETSSWAKGAQKFADLVKERSGGKYNVQLYANAQLAQGNQNQEMQMLQDGSIDFSWQSNIMWSTWEPKMTVISMPWMFKDNAAVDKFTSSDLGKTLLKTMEAKGIESLAYGENGWRQITNNRNPIVAPADLKGMKLRIPGMKMFTDLYKDLGVNPTVMAIGEVYVALQQGGIDGQENPLGVIVSSKFQEVQKYITMWDYVYDAEILSMSKKNFDSLSKEDQDMIRQAAIDAAKYEVQVNRDEVAQNLKVITDKGVKVTTLTQEQKDAFSKVVSDVYTQWEPTLGADLIKQMKDFSK